MAEEDWHGKGVEAAHPHRCLDPDRATRVAA